MLQENERKVRLLFLQPEKLELEGYWESDGPDVSSTLTLEDITWKLKSDTEEYTESSPAGTYSLGIRI